MKFGPAEYFDGPSGEPALNAVVAEFLYGQVLVVLVGDLAVAFELS